MQRRTPALTKQARDMFEQGLREGAWLDSVVIAEATGLSPNQVRDSIYSESADTWRRAMTLRLREERNAIH